MPRVRFSAFFSGPQAIYTSSTGQQDPITGAQYLGTEFQAGNSADLSNADALVWNRQYNTSLFGGRYRIVGVASTATAANMGYGQPVGWSTNTGIASVGFTPGTGYTNGTYNISSTTTGSQVAAVAQVVVAAGAIISAGIVQQGSGFSPASIPTFSLAALGAGSGGAVIAQLAVGGGEITSFDASALSNTSMPRGILIANPAPTALQIAAGAWVVIQELGIAPVLINTATAATAGAQVVAVSGGTANSQANAYSALELGRAIDAPVAGQIIRAVLTLPELPF